MTIEEKKQYEQELKVVSKMLQRISKKLQRNITITNLHFAFTDDEPVDKTSIFIGVNRNELSKKGIHACLDTPRSVHSYYEDIEGILTRVELLEDVILKKEKKDE